MTSIYPGRRLMSYAFQSFFHTIAFYKCFKSFQWTLPDTAHYFTTSLFAGLPVPFRQPLRMVTGDIVLVKKNSSPSEEEINEVLDRVIAAVSRLYDTKKPEWETRPLVITWEQYARRRAASICFILFSHLLLLDFNFTTGIQSVYLFRLLVLWYCHFPRHAGVLHSLQLGLVTGN